MATINKLESTWRDANDKVRETEGRVAAAWAAYATGKGAPPTAALLQELSAVRTQCDETLRALLANVADSTNPGSGASEQRPNV